jgi:hypothetical protein
MKNTTFTISLVLLAISALQTNVFAGSETNSTYLEVLQASNNVATVIQTLPGVEKLWPQEPVAYIKSVSQAAHVFDGSLSDSNAHQAYLNLFASMMQKSCPTNEDQAASWIEQKRDIVRFCMRVDELRNNKSQWLAVAKFLGEVRSKKIPNYVNQGVMLSIMNLGPGGQAEMQKAVEENERKKITDQSQLWQAESSLMFQLQHDCPFTQPNQPVDSNFVSQVTSTAHLTDKESKELQGN